MLEICALLVSEAEGTESVAAVVLRISHADGHDVTECLEAEVLDDFCIARSRCHHDDALLSNSVHAFHCKVSHRSSQSTVRQLVRACHHALNAPLVETEETVFILST